MFVKKQDVEEIAISSGVIEGLINRLINRLVNLFL